MASETPDGLVVVVGRLQAGIDSIVKASAAIRPKIHLVAGGFHLAVARDPDIEAIATALRDNDRVSCVAPGHCTGAPKLAAWPKAFGERYLCAGPGSAIALAGTPHAARGRVTGTIGAR